MIEHLSYSSISSYLTCSRAWKYHYIDKLPEPVSPALMFGSAFHDTLEEIVGKNTIGEKPKQAHELFVSNFARHVENNELIDWQDTSHNDQISLAARMLNTSVIINEIHKLRAKVDSDGKPIIERKVELQVPDVPIPIIGYIDIILDDNTPADFKTASRAWSQDQAEKQTQSLFYIAALNQAGEDVNWNFRHIVVTKTLSPKLQMLDHSHEPRELFFLFDVIQSVWKGIEAEVFIPNSDSWKCSPKWCNFYSICKGKQ